MTALASEKERIPMWPETRDAVYLVAASQKIWAGALVVLNASGYAENATAAASKTAIGVARETVDNSSGSAGAKEVKVVKGIFKFSNKAGDLLALANTEGTAYIEDNDTVRATSTSTSAAGKVERVDSDGVFVRVGIY